MSFAISLEAKLNSLAAAHNKFSAGSVLTLLSGLQYSLFGSILTFGAMIGAITSGPIADFIGRKGVSALKLNCCCNYIYVEWKPLKRD